MTTIDPTSTEIDIVTPYGIVTRLPTSFPLYDADLDAHLDPDLFQQGFNDGLARLDQLPPSWASHHASSVMASAPDPDDEEPSYTRGYRAALYGHLRHGRR